MNDSPVENERLFAFAQSFAIMVHTGVSLVRTLHTLEKDASDPRWREAIRAVRLEVEAGGVLSDGLAHHPDIFPALLVTMIRAGEVGGCLDETPLLYAEYLRKEMELLAGRTPEEAGRAREMTLWCRRFGMMLAAGVPILQAMEVSAAGAASEELREAVVFARESVREGETFTQAFADFAGTFGEVAHTLLAAGEHTGRLDATMFALADYLEAQPERLDLRASSNREPGAPENATPASQPARDPKPSLPTEVEAALRNAVEQRAAELLIEPTNSGARIRLRRPPENRLETVSDLDADDGILFRTRLKEIADLNTGETRRPQRGRLALSIGGKEYEFRVFTYPFLEGEAVRIEVVDSEAWSSADLIALGMTENQRAESLQFMQQPHGMLIVAGEESRSVGRTLYALLRELRCSGALNEACAITIEDPVETALPDTMQVEATRLGTVEALRSALLHDPDVILVRRAEDAAVLTEISRAAATGRMILVGMRGRNAIEAAADISAIEPSIARRELVGVIGVRTIPEPCSACGGTGCPRCARTGYAGTRLAFELVGANSL